MPDKCVSAAFLSGLISLFCAWGLAGDEPVTPGMSNTYPTRNSLAAFYSAAPVSFSQLAAAVPDDLDVLVWACHSRELPDEARDPQVVANLRRFIERGGGLFVSFAQAYVVDLKLEDIAPDRRDFFRYGYNDASRFGGYFVVGVKEDARHRLLKGMTASESNASGFFLSGSSHIILENCFWMKRRLQRGIALGSYYRRNEQGQTLDQDNTQLLNLWTLGDGKVLGYGNNVLLEDFWFNRDRDNLVKFLHNAASFLSSAQQPRIGALDETPSRLHADTYASPPAFPQPQPHSLHRDLPGLPYIAHWGWHAQIQYQRAERQCVDRAYFEQKMIAEPFRWVKTCWSSTLPG